MKRRLTTLIATACALLAAATPAHAACADDGASPTFAAWGDNALYVEAPGGIFESELRWEPTGAPQLITDANPFSVGEHDVFSAALDQYEAITSPPICVSRNRPHLRFAARSIDTKAHLKLEVLWTDDGGKPKIDSLSDEDGNHYRSWRLSGEVKLEKVLPKDERVRDVRLRFTAGKGIGSWLVDNVFVDPVKSG